MDDTEATIEQIFAEISHLNGLIRQEQVAIDRLKAESKVITDLTDAVLSRLRFQLEALEKAPQDYAQIVISATTRSGKDDG